MNNGSLTEYREFLHKRASIEGGIFGRVEIMPYGCWEMRGSDPETHRVVKVAGKMHPAHRLMYELMNGAASIDDVICHTCDNPPCINPFHLVAGSPKMNALDAWQKGRNGDSRKMDNQAKDLHASLMKSAELENVEREALRAKKTRGGNRSI